VTIVRWKLTIPLMLFVFGVVSGIHQYYPNLFLFPDSDLLRSAQYILTLGVIFYIIGRKGIFEKRVHFSIGIFLILIGFLADYLTGT
jgi:hypothetical protein